MKPLSCIPGSIAPRITTAPTRLTRQQELIQLPASSSKRVTAVSLSSCLVKKSDAPIRIQNPEPGKERSVDILELIAPNYKSIKAKYDRFITEIKSAIINEDLDLLKTLVQKDGRVIHQKLPLFKPEK